MWIKEICPSCHTANWIFFGNLDGSTSLEDRDIEGIQCYKCGNTWIVDEDDVRDQYGFEKGLSTIEILDQYSLNIVNGLEKPE